MRDLFVAFIVFGFLPFILKRPFWGILMLAWLGYMNPHRLCYTFMYDMPVVQIVAIATLIGMLASHEAKRMVWSREVAVLLMFVAWMGLTTVQAPFFNLAADQYVKVLKIQILTFMTLLMLTSRQRVHLFIWMIVLSLGFYGVKGGIFTVVHGGVYRVQGPEGSFIGGNNEMALALVMTIPLMRYLHLQEKSKLVKLGLVIGMLLTALAAVGSQSRGALVGLGLMGMMFWVKSRNKLATALLIALAGLAAYQVMPDAWYQRMNTIETYDSDASAQGRINMWWTAWNLANHRIFGGGFEFWAVPAFNSYAPDPNNMRAVHSIYFQVLGDHGWIGLVIFLSLLGLTWLKCNAVVRSAKRQPNASWARDLAAMIQVSLVAYLAAGAFLSLAYFDYLYHLVAVAVVIHSIMNSPQRVASEPRRTGNESPTRIGIVDTLPQR